MEREALEHPPHHVEKRKLLCVTGSSTQTSRAGMGWEVERRFKKEGHMCTYGRFMLMYGRNKHSIVEQLSSY